MKEEHVNPLQGLLRRIRNKVLGTIEIDTQIVIHGDPVKALEALKRWPDENV